MVLYCSFVRVVKLYAGSWEWLRSSYQRWHLTHIEFVALHSLLMWTFGEGESLLPNIELLR